MTGLIKHWLIISFVLVSVIAIEETGKAAEQTVNPDSATVDPGELLEIEPISEVVPVNSENVITPDPTSTVSETKSSPYPVADWTPEPTIKVTPAPTSQAAIPDENIKELLLSPYYFSAYTPELDRTEVDLGLVLSQSPGLDIAIAWGALEELMATAKMTVQGASYSAGIRMSYLLRQEQVMETKPGIAGVIGWRVQNYRNDDEQRSTIFRGNRLYLGGVVSKDIGSLAKSLNAEKSIVDFFSYFRIHIEAIAEFQTGRMDEIENELMRFEIGLKSALEVIVNPDNLYITLTYQSLSDRINSEDQYIGIRYYPRKDFALDVIGGWLGNQATVNVSLAWIF